MRQMKSSSSRILTLFKNMTIVSMITESRKLKIVILRIYWIRKLAFSLSSHWTQIGLRNLNQFSRERPKIHKKKIWEKSKSQSTILLNTSAKPINRLWTLLCEKVAKKIKFGLTFRANRMPWWISFWQDRSRSGRKKWVCHRKALLKTAQPP